MKKFFLTIANVFVTFNSKTIQTWVEFQSVTRWSLVAALLSVMSLSTAQAADSGCGLGNVIIQKNSKGLQLLSWTTNGILLTQPLGITSGTSGCSSSGLVSNDKEIEYFVEVNQDDLSREMAIGKGEKLETLASLSGCKTNEAKQAFASMTQQNFDNIYTDLDVTPQGMIQNLKAEMIKNQQVGRMCGLVASSDEVKKSIQ